MTNLQLTSWVNSENFQTGNPFQVSPSTRKNHLRGRDKENFPFSLFPPLCVIRKLSRVRHILYPHTRGVAVNEVWTIQYDVYTVYIHAQKCLVYIYIYIERERERDFTGSLYPLGRSTCSVHILYVLIFRSREKKSERSWCFVSKNKIRASDYFCIDVFLSPCTIKYLLSCTYNI